MGPAGGAGDAHVAGIDLDDADTGGVRDVGGRVTAGVRDDQHVDRQRHGHRGARERVEAAAEPLLLVVRGHDDAHPFDPFGHASPACCATERAEGGVRR